MPVTSVGFVYVHTVVCLSVSVLCVHVTVFLLFSKIKQKRLRAGFNFTLFNRDLNLPDEWS